MTRALEVGHAARGGRQNGGGGEQSDSGDAHQQPAGRRLTRQLRELTLQLRDTDLEHADLLEQLLHDRTQQCADRRLLVGHSATNCLQTGARAPTGTCKPSSREKPRSALMREVRVPIHSERVRCSACRLCCSTDLTLTATMSAQRAASSSARASAASVLLRRTYART